MAKITKAIIPCAGMGTRFMPITKAVPKELLPVIDTPVLSYIVNEENDVVEVTIVLDESDMGKVIGRQGKLAKALRTIVRSYSVKEGKKYNVEIKAKGEI